MTVEAKPPAQGQRSAEVRPRPLTGGAVMTAASRVTAAVTAAATGVAVARLLGPGGAGRYAIAQTLIALLTVATTLGVEHGITYYVSSGRWTAAGAQRQAQRVAFVSGIAGASLGVLARVAFPSAFAGLSLGTTAVIAYALPFALSWFYFSFVALAIDHYEAFVLPAAVQSTVGLVLVSVLGAIYGLPGAVVGLALSHVVTAAAAGVAARRILSSPASQVRISDEPAPLRRAISFGVKGYAANALQFINYRLDLFILASVAASADVGHYAVAIAVTGVMWLLPGSLSEVLFPRVAALSAVAGAGGARASVETKSIRHTTLIVVASSVAVALALLFLVVPVYGEAFRPAITLGLIMLPGVALIGLAGPMASIIVGRGHPGYSLIVTLIVTPVTIVLYVLLIPPLHAEGAALASSISYAISFVLVVIFYGRVADEPVLSQLIPTRSEIDDYRALAPAIQARIRGFRGGRAGRRP